MNAQREFEMRENDIIVEVVGEGGSQALYGIVDNGRWYFARRLIAAPPSGVEQAVPGGIVDSFPSALQLLNRAWPRLAPSYVHPAFRSDFLAAATAALPDEVSSLERWKEACRSGLPNEAPRVTRSEVHVSDSWLYEEVDALEPTDSEIEETRAELRALGVSEKAIDSMAPRRPK